MVTRGYVVCSMMASKKAVPGYLCYFLSFRLVRNLSEMLFTGVCPFKINLSEKSSIPIQNIHQKDSGQAGMTSIQKR
jgi:hypothetical protein